MDMSLHSTYMVTVFDSSTLQVFSIRETWCYLAYPH
jgi:hypothetical protein